LRTKTISEEDDEVGDVLDREMLQMRCRSPANEVLGTRRRESSNSPVQMNPARVQERANRPLPPLPPSRSTKPEIVRPDASNPSGEPPPCCHSGHVVGNVLLTPGAFAVEAAALSLPIGEPMRFKLPAAPPSLEPCDPDDQDESRLCAAEELFGHLRLEQDTATATATATTSRSGSVGAQDQRAPLEVVAAPFPSGATVFKRLQENCTQLDRNLTQASRELKDQAWFMGSMDREVGAGMVAFGLGPRRLWLLFLL
jgi:hypothetical protein